MDNISGVQQIIAEELKIFEQKFAESVKSKTALLDTVMQYVIKRKGKQIRPMFVFLCAKMFGPINDSTYRAAALVEMLHTATLVHDDVVDESLERRGFFSINALWKNKVAVLVGDYLLSKGLILSAENGDFQQLQIMSDAVRKMSEGELLQIEKSRKLNLDEEVYYEIIKGKTASLLSAACGIGTFSTTGNMDTTGQMKEFGENVGIAFQIKDDLFDYGSADIGKPTGNDIKEKKLTLPLIYALNNIDKSSRQKMIYIIKNERKDKQKVQWVIDKVIGAGGIAYAENKMFEFKDKALSIIQRFDASAERTALEDLVNFTTSRKY